MGRGILWAVVEDRTALLRAVPPRFEEVEGHHLTLRFGVALAPYAGVIGRRFEASATHEAWNGESQALRVDLPADVAELCENAHPHVTISHAPGVGAKRSNTMLAGEHEERRLGLTLAFRIEAQRWGR